MSFDTKADVVKKVNYASQSLWNRAMSFDNLLVKFFGYRRLNPFGTGQCLSTRSLLSTTVTATVSIPLEQGNVFRR